MLCVKQSLQRGARDLCGFCGGAGRKPCISPADRRRVAHHNGTGTIINIDNIFSISRRHFELHAARAEASQVVAYLLVAAVMRSGQCPGRGAARSGAPQTRDRSGLWRSRISGAPLRAAHASGTREEANVSSLKSFVSAQAAHRLPRCRRRAPSRTSAALPRDRVTPCPSSHRRPRVIMADEKFLSAASAFSYQARAAA
jgi:hypothetical protein